MKTQLKYLGLAGVLAIAGCSAQKEDRMMDRPEGSVKPKTTVTQHEPGSRDEFVQIVGDRVFFSFDKYAVDASSRVRLERQAAWLNKFKNVTVTITGHCDVRGTREYNLALGERRAMAARNVLVELGVEARRIKVVSYGKVLKTDEVVKILQKVRG